MTTRPHIFVVEDDPEIRDLIHSYLERNGYRCDAGESGAALDRFISTFGDPDLIVLDLMLPGEDGLEICQRLRATSQVPVLMLTARADEIDRIVGLDLGADDYLAKPFNPRELTARIKAILRRNTMQQIQKKRLEISRNGEQASILVDLEARNVSLADGEPIDLTAAEFDLFECFITRPQRVLSRDQLMDWTRGRRAEAFDRTIDVQMSRLRKKVDTGAKPFFKTIRNHGYIFTAQVKGI